MADFVTVTFACTIIAANTREPFNARLHRFPYFEPSAEAVDKNHGHPAWGAGASNGQSVIANGNESGAGTLVRPLECENFEEQ